VPRAATRRSRTRPCATRWACSSTARACRTSSTAHRRGHAQLPEQPPALCNSKNLKFEFNVDKANQILEAAGWKKGTDGIRAKGNVKLKFVYQTSVNQPRQKNQAIVKDACAKAGIDLEFKSVTAAVFFGGDFANPDTYQKFWADMEMYTTTMTQPDPQLFMEQFCQLGAGAEGKQVGQAQPMQEQDIRDLIEQVRDGKLPRRSFIADGRPGPDGADGVDAADARRRGAGADRPFPTSRPSAAVAAR
jgi:hypothetical protein